MFFSVSRHHEPSVWQLGNSLEVILGLPSPQLLFLPVVLKPVHGSSCRQDVFVMCEKHEHQVSYVELSNIEIVRHLHFEHCGGFYICSQSPAHTLRLKQVKVYLGESPQF